MAVTTLLLSALMSVWYVLTAKFGSEAPSLRPLVALGGMVVVWASASAIGREVGGGGDADLWFEDVEAGGLDVSGRDGCDDGRSRNFRSLDGSAKSGCDYVRWVWPSTSPCPYNKTWVTRERFSNDLFDVSVYSTLTEQKHSRRQSAELLW